MYKFNLKMWNNIILTKFNSKIWSWEIKIFVKYLEEKQSL